MWFLGIDIATARWALKRTWFWRRWLLVSRNLSFPLKMPLFLLGGRHCHHRHHRHRHHILYSYCILTWSCVSAALWKRFPSSRTFTTGSLWLPLAGQNRYIVTNRWWWWYLWKEIAMIIIMIIARYFRFLVSQISLSTTRWSCFNQVGPRLHNCLTVIPTRSNSLYNTHYYLPTIETKYLQPQNMCNEQ